ncbi:MAG: ArsR family transcriptional regulator [Anditalea sp.]
MLDSLITSKTRLKLLVKFFINANNHSHLRGLAEEFGESTNAIRKELNHLTEAGYLQKEAIKNKISYSANTQHPLFGNLQVIVRKYVGFDTLVDQVLERMGAVERVVVTGDYANGVDSGTISVNIIGRKINKSYIRQLSRKVEGLIERKVNFKIKETEDVSEGLILYERKTNK